MLAGLVRLSLHLKLEHGGVLREINPAVVTLPSVRLHVLAGGASIAEGGVTASAELGPVGTFVPTLRTAHSPL